MVITENDSSQNVQWTCVHDSGYILTKQRVTTKWSVISNWIATPSMWLGCLGIYPSSQSRIPSSGNIYIIGIYGWMNMSKQLVSNPMLQGAWSWGYLSCTYLRYLEKEPWTCWAHAGDSKKHVSMSSHTRNYKVWQFLESPILRNTKLIQMMMIPWHDIVFVVLFHKKKHI